MKRATILLILAALVVPFAVRAASLDDAHRAFAEGRYHDSAQAYQAVLAEKGYSAPVLFDLGNSLYREGDFPQAILAYERAQWLAPGDRDIAANLRQAQAKAGLTPATSTRIETFARRLNTTQWAWLGCVAWTVFCLSILGRTLLPRAKALFVLSGALGVIVLGGAIAAIAFSSQALGQAVVVDKNAAALISPFPAAQKVFAPSPGETVTMEKAYDDFVLVIDSAGHSGWIAKNQVAPVIPPA